MWNNLTRNFMANNDDVIIKVDPNWGFSEFPSPGDTKKHLLPILIDPEFVAAPKAEVRKEEVVEAPQNKFWMPDRFCKVCYGCEEAFTMYRRRHHCRMCGQIFCNGCSSFYIEGKLFNSPGLVRACRLCYDQQYDRGDHEYKAPRLKSAPAAHHGHHPQILDVDHRSTEDPQNRPVIAVAPTASWIAGGHVKLQDVTEIAESRSSNLQKKASAHLSSIVDRLLSSSAKVQHGGDWKDLIVHLVGEVVSSVDPDVRAGRDNMDIRPYVKIKVIPGGSIDESVYVDGVVFRKNVSHKKMGANASRTNPRILLISEGIEFQRADMKLSSMDTLIEQEDKHMEIAVEKIMSLKPDIILVGKAIGRKAQELLCGRNVVVMQNVKAHLLERIGRMTGAMLLPSTDHMIKQFGEECLGSCTHFRLSVVHDDPEKKLPNQVRRILETRIARGSTYAYIQGCPSDRGCSIILRGADRATLKEIKRILAFSVSVAYHLRLEVAYYMDRYASLPPAVDELPYDDGSDVDDGLVDVPYEAGEGGEDSPDSSGVVPKIRSRTERQLLSTSLDIDISLPFARELVGTDLFMHAKSMRNKTSVDSHQTLLVTSLLIGEGPSGMPAQKASADVKGIKYYTKQDIALGQFIIENCFQMTRAVNRESTMLDQTLSFVHRTGRVDITVHRSDFSSSSLSGGFDEHGQYIGRDPRVLPIFLSSFCKVCKKMVTPPKLMSDETWKMSFGKFLEIQYYNRSARCSIGDCSHRIRDDHTLYIQCESYVADFNFVPIHPYALNVRSGMTFPTDFHTRNSVDLLKTLPLKHAILIEDFRLAMGVLEREIRDLMGNRPEDLSLAIADVAMMENELVQCSTRFLEDLIKTLEHIPLAYRSFDADFLPGLVERVRSLKQTPLHRMASNASEAPRFDLTSTSSLVFDQPPTMDDGSEATSPTMTQASGEDSPAIVAYSAAHAAPHAGLVGRFASSFNAEVGLNFPFSHFRETYLYAVHWNNRMNTIYKFLESVSRVIAANQAHALLPTIAEVTDADYDEYLDSKKVLSELVLQDSAATGMPLTLPVPITASFGEPSPPVPGMPHSSPSRDGFLGSHMEHAQSLQNIAGRLEHTQSMQNITGRDHNQSMSNITASAAAQKARGEKPMDKMSRFTKVLQRFLVLGNKEAVAEQHTKFFVPLEDFAHGRFGLKPGRRGEVVPVYEDEYATIIAYSLASDEYHHSLQEHLHEGGSSTDGHNSFAAQYATSPNSVDGGSEEMSSRRKTPEQLQDPHDEDEMDFHAEADTPITADNTSPTTDKDTSRPGIAQSLLSGLNKQRNRLDRRANSEKPPTGFSERTDVDVDAELETDPNTKISMDRAFANAAADDEAEHAVTAFATGSTLFQPESGSASGSLKSSGDSSRKLASVEDEATQACNKADQANARSQNEKQMVSQDKSYIRHRFDDMDDRGNVVCKFQCQTYWAKQFEAVRACYFKGDDRESYLRSLATSKSWTTQGGKSGAAFSKSSDDRLVVKCISRVELQMFLEFAPAYFEYMAKAYYHNLPTVLCKILGVYTIRFDNKETGRKAIENVVVMENIFYQRNITRTFDLKGSSRARYVDLGHKVENFDEALARRRLARRMGGEVPAVAERVSQVLMDDNLMELTKGRPFPLKHRAKLFFHKAVQNDTLFLSIINVVDYSILAGFDEDTHEVVVGIIDYMRQYDIIKKMERMGKSVGMIAGQAEPTIIQPSQYRKRFSLAMERYFMTIPDKWITHES